MELRNQFVTAKTNKTTAIVVKLIEYIGCGHNVD
jgi:hypothetical protein